ncbi:MAG: transporter [Frankiales bacterium]|jgi:ABC-2 type transport system ATP-binding protein|nr:transporter [Frankiales bacterium]
MLPRVEPELRAGGHEGCPNPYADHVNDTALEVVDLVKRYDTRTALDGLSFDVGRGTVCALLGPNGAGKTSTVEIAEGFRTADGGSVTVLGHRPQDPAVRPRVGVMPQSGGGYPGLKAAELLDLFAAFHAHPLDPSDLIERLGLGEVAGTPFRRLSGGQQQRLSLAMAVVGRPELVFLDEPTAGLDPQARRATWELIEALRHDGVTVLLTTHLMDEAEQLADDVVVIDHGRLVARGTVAALTHSDGEIRFRAAPGLALEIAGATVTETEGRYLVRGLAGPALLAAVTGWCATHGVMPQDLQTQRSLEDVFLDLTGRDLRS